ncbi:hypothetical protein KUTeg_010912 [Tegillarca granosa]|uniref:Uncharacterized protein n=1 Tax=Tegillarca granosa TaxID=220873 RepID=A0ABQ9F2E7_TEGGR|nr:hypothetical protein KUTeg_010912 [Tegillarca granosa]
MDIDRWYSYQDMEKIRILEDSETGVEDDLLKIKYYYSWLLCVNKQNLAKTELCFMWNLITKAVVRIGGSEFKTEIENLASSQTCDPFKIPDKHTQKQVNNPREPALNDALKHDHSKIHEASMFGHCDEVKELLQNGADANERNNALETPLYISAKHGHLDVVKELLKNGADTNKWEYTGETPLYISAKHGHLDVVKELLKNGADTNKRECTGETPLYISAKHGHLDVVKELLQAGADTKKCHIIRATPLYISAMHGHLDVVKELLQNGADKKEWNHKGETPLYISAKHGHLDVVKELLKNGADTNKWECTGATPLYISAKHGHLDVVKELLQNGANTNKCNDTGATPLYISAMHGHLDVVKELLQNGADTNKCYISGDTPLNVAFKHDHHDVVEVLLENKTDRNIKAVDDNYEADVYRKTSNVEKSVLKQKASLKGELTCDQSEIERIQKIFNKIDISVPTTNRQFVVPTGKMFHIYFIHSSDPSDTLWVETTIKTIQNHGFKCCGGLSKIMNEQSFEKIKTDSCVLCLVLTRYFMEEAGKECIEILKSQQCKVLAIQLSEYKETDFQFENVTTIDARDFAEKQIEWFQELLEYLKKTDLQNVNVIANEMFNCEPSTAFRVTSCVADAEPIDILIHTDKVEKPIITDILQNRVKITNPKLVSKESGVINAMILIKAWLCSFMGFVWKISGSNTDFWLRRIKPSLFTESCRGNISGIRYFLDVKRANINDKDGLVGLSPLHLAAINGHYRVVDFLLNREADPNVKADSACYPYLLEYTKDDLNLYFGDCKDASALRLAILFDQDLCVKILLKKGWKMSIEELSICTKISERNKKIEQIFLQYLADNIIQKYSDLKFEVRFCYKPGPPNERIIMCYTNDVYDVINDNYLGVTIRIQNPNIIDDEDSIIFETEPTNNYIIDQKTLSLMEKVIQCNGDRLFESHSNLNIITVSAATLSKKGGVTKGPCIVLYCTTKDVIPLNEEPFPHFLYWNQEKVVTDIREGYFSLCPGGVAERDWNNPLRSGASIGIRGDESQEATMGPFVQLRDGSLGFITCAHLFNTVQNDLKTFVVQPSYTVLSTDGVTKEDKDCGFLVRKIFEPRREVSIDAAVVKITSRIPNRGCFAFNSIFQLQEAGFDRVNYPVFDSGSVKKEINPEDTPKIIIKFGSNTGLTRGAFRLNGVQVRVKRKINLTTPINPQTFTMKGQYEIQSVGPKDFFQPGDSGSGVYIVDENKQLHCIGIAIGCTSYRSTIVTPIKDVLEALDLPSKLKTFKPENMQH